MKTFRFCENEEPGLVMYFGIFSFQNIIDILRENYQVKARHEETSHSNKFTYCLYFDKELIFYAMRSFIKIYFKQIIAKIVFTVTICISYLLIYCINLVILNI